MAIERRIISQLHNAVNTRDSKRIDLGNELLQALQSVKERGYVDSDEPLEYTQDEPFVYYDARITHNYTNRTLEIDGVEVHLSPNEHGLLLLFTKTPNQLVPYPAFRDPGYEGAKGKQLHDVIKVQVRRLRAKIDPPNAERSCIVAVSGVGYRFTPHGSWRKIPLQQPPG